MGEAKQRSEEIEQIKNQAIQQKAQFDLMARMGQMAAVFVNGYHLSETNGIIRLTFVDGAVPAPGYEGVPRFTAAVPKEMLIQMRDGFTKLVEFMEKGGNGVNVADIGDATAQSEPAEEVAQDSALEPVAA